MAHKVIMPKQGLQMTEGIITHWLIQEGQSVTAGQPLFEMETDKLSIEIEAPESGTLLKIVRPEGDTVPITETIAIIGEIGEDYSALLPQDTHIESADHSPTLSESLPTLAKQPETWGNQQSGGRVFATPRARQAASEKGIDFQQVHGSGPDGLVIERDILNSQPSTLPKATALAKKIADLNEVNLADISGSGNRGKITKSDVLDSVSNRQPAVTSERSESIIPFTGMRKAIADKMMQSLHGMAQANHRMKVDMSEIVRFRDQLKINGVKVSYTDILIKVVSKALLDFPIVNSTLTPEGIVCKHDVHMGLAVAVENGLIVPVIRNADRLSLSEITAISAELIHKAKSGNLKPDDYRGGTFTITNLGMFDIDEFTAVINHPESAILAVGKIDRIPVVEGDSIAIRPVMVLSLTYDHRIIDGAPAAQFLQRIKQLLQNPFLLI